jgi:hypothetical protein
MPNPPHQQPLSDFRFILRWSGVIGLLWLLVLWKGFEYSSQYFYSYLPTQTAITFDDQIYAVGERQFSSRSHTNGLLSPPPSDQSGIFISALFFGALIIIPPLKTRLEPRLIHHRLLIGCDYKHSIFPALHLRPTKNLKNIFN